MTRTTKANDIPHNNPEVASFMTEAHYPKFFAKSGFVDTAPSKTKKDGGGKGNWGHPGDELEDLDEFNMTRPRRYSNTSPTNTHFGLKSKFEAHEEDPLFDEERHGPLPATTDEHVVTTTSSATAVNGTDSGPTEEAAVELKV
ncbi:hypothetical protein TWF481_004748 [Arthrobotrys musiformis]|uniref:STF2-like protein n=1 Tax=Arthrobotrys musiformis TaxID=47236 RepID=A0AAV9WKW2_9PEZI